MKTQNITLHKNWKIVREIKINKELERELEAILGKHVLLGGEKNNGHYATERRSIIKKNRNKKKLTEL